MKAEPQAKVIGVSDARLESTIDNKREIYLDLRITQRATPNTAAAW